MEPRPGPHPAAKVVDHLPQRDPQRRLEQPPRPSSDSSKAVSSPQMYAPAPRCTWTSNAKSVPPDPRPQPAVAPHPLDHRTDPRRLRCVFAPDVDKPLGGPDRISGDRHPFEQQLRLQVQQHAVLEAQRLRLVRVGHDVLRPSALRGHHPPLAARRKPRPAAAAESRRIDFVQHRLRRAAQNGLQPRKPAGGKSRIDRVRFHRVRFGQQHARLPRHAGCLNARCS